MTRPLPGRQPDNAERVPHLGGAPVSRAKRALATDSEPLISFEEAARILGLGERSLRKIIQRSRERIEGRWTSGPTIRFFQVHPKAAIKFRPEWLDEFICQHTHDPSSASRRIPEVFRRKTNEQTTGFGLPEGATEPELGFDSQLYDL